MNGYRPEPVRIVTCDQPAPAEGSEPFTVTIVRLHNDQVDALPWGKDVKVLDVLHAGARYIIAWNLEAHNAETGEWERVAPPAEAGVDVFNLLWPGQERWLAEQLKFGHLWDGSLPKGLISSRPTPEPANVNGSD